MSGVQEPNELNHGYFEEDRSQVRCRQQVPDEGNKRPSIAKKRLVISHIAVSLFPLAEARPRARTGGKSRGEFAILVVAIEQFLSLPELKPAKAGG